MGRLNDECRKKQALDSLQTVTGLTTKRDQLLHYRLSPTGQAGNLAIVLALTPCLEMIPAALLVAVAGGMA